MTRWPPMSTSNYGLTQTLANPLQPAAASAASFMVGSLLPLLRSIWLPTSDVSASVTFVAVLIAVGLAGALSARVGGSHLGRAVLRSVIGGPDEYRQALPVLRCLPQASTLDETPALSSRLVTATG